MEITEHVNFVLEQASLEDAVEAISKNIIPTTFRITPLSEPILTVNGIGLDQQRLIQLLGEVLVALSRNTGEASLFIPQTAIHRRGRIELNRCNDRFGYILKYIEE